MDELFLKRLMERINCSVCGEHYDTGDVSVLGHHDTLWFLRVVCNKCSNQGLVAAVVKDSRTVEHVTDLTEAESEKFLGSSPVSMDDRLDIHNSLREFDGDFIALFSSE
jgi:ribosomal protein S27E